MPYFGKAQIASEQFKSVLHDTMIDAELKQEVIAHQGGVKQCTVSQWVDPLSDRHLPAFEMLLLDEKIVVPLSNLFIKRFGKMIVNTQFVERKNGTILDEVLEIGKIEGRLVDLIDSMDKKRINELCEALEHVVLRLRQEAL